MGQFVNSVLGKTEDQKQQTPQEQPPKKEDTKGKAEPEIIKAKPVEINTKNSGAGDSHIWHQTSVDMVEDMILSMPNAHEIVDRLNKKLDKLVGKKFHRVFVNIKDPEGSYTNDEVEAVESWGANYQSVFRLAEESPDGKPRPLGRVATPEETKELLIAEKKTKEKQRKK